jgi:hypothetical protein
MHDHRGGHFLHPAMPPMFNPPEPTAALFPAREREAIRLYADLLRREFDRIERAEPRMSGVVANCRHDLDAILRWAGVSRESSPLAGERRAEIAP